MKYLLCRVEVIPSEKITDNVKKTVLAEFDCSLNGLENACMAADRFQFADGFPLVTYEVFESGTNTSIFKGRYGKYLEIFLARVKSYSETD
jgi:hypothetical protein